MTNLKLSYFSEYRIYELSESGVVPQRTERYFPGLVCCLKIANQSDLKKIDDVLQRHRSDFWIFNRVAKANSTFVITAKASGFKAVITLDELTKISQIEKELENFQFEKMQIPELGMEYVPSEVEFTPEFRDGVPILNQDFFRRSRKD